MPARVIARTVFAAAPRSRVAVYAASYYTALQGVDLLSIHSYESRSDTADVSYLRRSGDNGRTWSAPLEVLTQFEDPGGKGRRYHAGGYVDPLTGRYVTVWNEGVLPTDDPLEGMRRWRLHYSVSEDGGLSEVVRAPVVHEGAEYDAQHPLPGVWVGKNCAMMGDLGERPLTRSDGAILVPVQSTPLGPDGDYYNPGGGYTYTDCLVLIGRWTADKRLIWTASERVVGDPQRSTRGLIEPTLAELADGTLLMVMRGSNDRRPDLPGFKWVARSRDGGHSWTPPIPWTYTDGAPFYSPSSCSQLVPWKDGRLFWLGNLTPENPRGNSPRYPMVLGEVDRGSGLLIRDRVSTIDDRQPGEPENLMLSNFYAREDRETGDLLLHMARPTAAGLLEPAGGIRTMDALLYRIAL